MFHDPTSFLRLHQQRVDGAAGRHAPSSRGGGAPTRTESPAPQRPGDREEVLVAPSGKVLSPTAFRLLHRINTQTDSAVSTTASLRAAVGVLITAAVPVEDVERLLPRAGEPPALVASIASSAIRHADEGSIAIAMAILDGGVASTSDVPAQALLNV